MAVVIFTAVSEDLTECLLLSDMPPARNTRSAYRTGGSVLLPAARPGERVTPPRNTKNGRFKRIEGGNTAASKIAAAARGMAARKRVASTKAAKAFFAYAGPSKCGKGRKGMKAGERTNRAGTKQGRPGVRCP